MYRSYRIGRWRPSSARCSRGHFHREALTVRLSCIVACYARFQYVLIPSRYRYRLDTSQRCSNLSWHLLYRRPPTSTISALVAVGIYCPHLWRQMPLVPRPGSIHPRLGSIVSARRTRGRCIRMHTTPRWLKKMFAPSRKLSFTYRRIIGIRPFRIMSRFVSKV